MVQGDNVTSTKKVTVYAGVSNVFRGILTMTAPTTNAEHFIEFLKRAEAARTDVGSNKKLVVVLD